MRRSLGSEGVSYQVAPDTAPIHGCYVEYSKYFLCDDEPMIAAVVDVAQLLGINDAQATAVLDVQFRRLSIEERTLIRADLEELNEHIQRPPAVDSLRTTPE